MQKQVTKCSFLEKRNPPFCSLFLKNLIGLKRTNPATTTGYFLRQGEGRGREGVSAARGRGICGQSWVGQGMKNGSCLTTPISGGWIGYHGTREKVVENATRSVLHRSHPPPREVGEANNLCHCPPRDSRPITGLI